MTAAVEELLQVDPGALVIGPNVRTDTHPDAREFAASVKARGVVEVITAHRADDGGLVVLRGQRRAVVAAQVGTPTRTVPVPRSCRGRRCPRRRGGWGSANQNRPCPRPLTAPVHHKH